MTARPDGPPQAGDVSRAVARIDQKMEGRPIMPDVEGLRRGPPGDVGDDPLHLAGPITQPRLGDVERGRGDVQHRHTAEPARHKAINKM